MGCAQAKPMADWSEVVESGTFGHIRVLGDIPNELHELAARNARCVDTTAVLDGTYELRKYALEQSICIDYHRYGHLGLREHDTSSVIGDITRQTP